MLKVKESYQINIYAYLIIDIQTMIQIVCKRSPLFAITAHSQVTRAKPIKIQESCEMDYTYNMDIFDINSQGVELANITLDLSVN